MEALVATMQLSWGGEAAHRPEKGHLQVAPLHRRAQADQQTALISRTDKASPENSAIWKLASGCDAFLM